MLWTRPLCRLVLLGLCLSVASAQTSSAQKAAELTERMKHSGDGIVELQYWEFPKMVGKKGRKYGLILLFSSSSDECTPCRVVREQLAVVAMEFRKQHIENQKLFFLEVDDSEPVNPDAPISMKDVFGLFRTQSVPRIVYISPSKKGATSYDFVEHDLKRGFGWTSFELAQFVWDQTGIEIRNVPHSPSAPTADSESTTLLLTIIIGGSTGALVTLKLLPVALSCYKEPMMYFVLALIFWWLMTSGLTYNILTRPPNVVADPYSGGGATMIMPNARGQTSIEGYLMGGLQVGGVLLLIFLNEFIGKFLHDEPNNQTMFSIAIATAVVIVLLRLRQTYQYKSPGYLYYP